MRWIFAIMFLFLAVHAFAEDAPAPTEMAAKVKAVMDAADPGDLTTLPAAEEALVALGKAAMPDVQKLYDEACKAKQAAEDKGDEEEALSQGIRANLLDRAYIRLRVGFNPPLVIRNWVKAQYPDNLQPFADSLPEPVRITDLPVARTYPNWLFYVSRFDQYSRADRLPPPLTATSLFVIRIDLLPRPGQQPAGNQVFLLSQDNMMIDFFKGATPPIIKPNVYITKADVEAAMKDVAYSWLRLSEELTGDGFFRFTIPPDKLKVTNVDGWYLATGQADVLPIHGDTGFITIELGFDGATQLINISAKGMTKPGDRNN